MSPLTLDEAIRAVVNVVPLLARRLRDPQLPGDGLPGLAYGEVLDGDVADGVLLRHACKGLAFAKVPLRLGWWPHELIRHKLHHVMQRPLPRRFIDDGGHLLV